MDRISADCAAAVEQRFRAELENIVSGILGEKPGAGNWITYELEAASH